MSEFDEIFHRWNPRLELVDNKGNIMTNVEGISSAGFNTSLFFDRIGGGLLFDSSVVTRRLPKNIFITHPHGDHVWNIVKQLSNYEGDEKVNIYCPAPIKERLIAYIEAGFRLSVGGEKELKIHNKYEIIPLSPGEYKVILENVAYKLDVIKCDHPVPCDAYGFSEIRKRRKPIYDKIVMKKFGEKINETFMALPKAEQTEKNRENIFKKYLTLLIKEDIKDALSKGLPKPVVYETYEYPLFLVCGDTTHKIFSEDEPRYYDPRFKKYPYIFVECSFVKPEDKKKAKKDKHMHWDNLRPIIEANSNNKFILMHFSRRDRIEEIRTYIDVSKFSNLYLFLPKTTMDRFLSSLSKLTSDEILKLINPINPFNAT